MYGRHNMKIAIGNDHAAVKLKAHIKQYLESKDYEVVDFGATSEESSDYPVYAQLVANAIVSGECEAGVLICGTGVGISIAANKINGIRACVCSEPLSAEMSRRHNDANIIAFGARVVEPDMAEKIVDAFFEAEYEGGRHQRRVDMLRCIEEGKNIDA